jgi:hypothetical protein
MRDQLDSWWRSRLTAELRDRLLAVGDEPLPADLALEVWRRSGPVHAVDHLGDHAGGWEWRLTDEVMAFLRTRASAAEQDDGDPDVDEGLAPPRPLQGTHGQS